MGNSSQPDGGSSPSPLPSDPHFDPPSSPEDETVVRSDDASSPTGEKPPPQALPSQFGRYHITRTLGKGGMGVVYLAHDSQLDRNVALKVPHFDRDENPDVIDRFYREARAMGTLNHPNLCSVYDVGEHDGLHFLTMAFIEGEELSALIKDPQKSEKLNVADIVRKVALALEEAHQAGLVHRDLKPSNIMIDRRGEPVVMDFGLARRNRQGEAEITQNGAIVGTPAYMSLEQIQGDAQHIGPAADIYSLGVIFYQMLAGRLPFEGTVTSILTQVIGNEPKPPSAHAKVDPALEAICLKAMAKNAEDRFSSMANLAEALAAVQSSPALAQARARRAQSAARPAVVPGQEHDVLIAYFGSDDEPPPGTNALGWVTTMVENLDWRLRQLSGQPEKLSVWMEENLARQPVFDEAFSQRLNQTATVLLVVSPGFLGSEWFQNSSRFLELIRGFHLPENRVFLVEHERVDDRPDVIANLRGIPFWKTTEDGFPRLLGYPQPHPETDAEYYARIDDLARLLHARLTELIGSKTPAPTPTPEVSSLDDTIDFPVSLVKHGSVFLAEVTDDLDPLRDEISRYLSQSGFTVLPQTWYARDPEGFRQEMQQDLTECLLFVQPLGPFAGKKPPGANSSYPKLQYELAVQNNLPVMQWRDVNLDPAAMADSDHKTLLDGVYVEAVELEQFKRDIVQRAMAEKAKRDASHASGVEMMQDQAFIFINIERGDLPIADDLCDLLESQGYSYALPMHEGRPDEIRQDLEANLLDCDGLIVVYGEITEQWVREQLRQWRKILYRRDKPLRALAVYEGPPCEKQRLGMRLPKMHVLDCRQGMEEDKILTFLNALQTK